ncbi:MAG: DNA-binding protein WhiA [Oscillospiraceae bacterium]|nr:DNA-binding protein WhiA [Oscillospiraceae bacterium]
MSFAGEVKEELLNIEKTACCEQSEARGLLLFGRELSPSSVSFLTENGSVASAFANAVHLFSGHTPETQVSASGNYKIVIENRNINDALLSEVLPDGLNSKKQLTVGEIERDCCKASFIRGAFLAGGTVTNPDTEYHLEFSCPSKTLANDLMELIRQLGIEPKTAKRAGNNIVYIKKSGDIEDILSAMGATETSMMLMGAKMYKDVRNTINRRVNFENANIARSVEAAMRQYEAIELIEKKQGLDSLPAELKRAAALRLENPDVSTGEIRKLLGEELSLSGLNHRFKKLIDMAQELKKDDDKRK